MEPENGFEARLAQLLLADPIRMQILKAVAALSVDNAFVAAGFLRNLVWDALHAIHPPTPLNDVDVIYFDNTDPYPHAASDYQAQLTKQLPDVRWQVKNQAVMHKRNGDNPYTGIVDAMQHWPEKETAVAVQLHQDGFTFVSGFGFESLFNGRLSWNPARDQRTFLHRVEQKQWLSRWPKLQITMR